MIELDKNLVSFCETDRQREIIESVIKHGSTKVAAEILNTPQRWIQKTIQNVKRRAALKGYSPNHDMTKTCPDPFVVKGTSTLYNKDGEISAQWVKTAIDEEKLGEYLQSVIEASLTDIKPVKLSRCNTKNNDPDTLTIYPIADLHVGMLAWMQETGGDYDIKIVEEVFKKILTKLIERAPSSKQALVCQLGDLLHTDNLRNETERSGNSLDVDSRYAKIYTVAMKLIRFAIETAASKHKDVYVINCLGNHDDMGAITLNVALANIYENNKRIHVVNNPAPRQYFRFGKNLIGATHGYDCAPKDLPIVMATERKKDWGETDFHYFYCGHIHQDKMIEVAGCKVESFRTIAGRDAWTNSKGYLSGRDLKALVLHRDYGEIERYTIASDPKMYFKKN